MIAPDRATTDQRTPVTIITGFLGSGKTTLLNHLLSDPRMADTAVVINEFGEISIDHLLVETAIENTLLLQNGCICCTIRGDLIDTLSDLMTKRRNGQVPSFARVMIETTGLADPVPILQTLATDPLITPLFRLQTIVATVDAANGPGQLDTFPEAEKQVALADIAILTKSDLADSAQLSALRRRLSKINPSLTMLEVLNGAISSNDLFSHVAVDPKADPEQLQRWLQFDAFAHENNRHDEHGNHHDHHHNDPNRHGNNIHAYAIRFDKPITRDGLRLWLSSLFSLRGQDLLRVKGILNVVGECRPVILHGVQHVIHPLAHLRQWPDADHSSRIVFILRNISRQALLASVRSCLPDPD